MAEQEKKTKKKRTFGSILRWICLNLISVLVILALFFRVPWKVIVLLFIILAACTVLPKTYRKWFWFSVVAVVVVLIIWVFLPEDNEGWRPYTFDEELADLNAKYAIPDSENAAKIYNNLLEGYDFDTMLADFLDPNLENLTRCEPWSSENYPELAKWLEERKYIIKKLLEASKFEKCRFPIGTDPWSLSQSTQQATMRLWAKLLIRAENNDLADGRINEAIEKNLAIFQIAKHQYQRPMATDLLVAMAIEAFATKQCNKFVVNGNTEEEHLNIFEKAVADIKHDWSSDITRILECEKLMAKNMMCGMAYEIHSDGRTRFSRDPAAAMRSEFPEELPPLTYWQTRLAKAGTVLGWFFMPSTPQKAGEIFDDSYEQLYSIIEPGFDWEKEPAELSLRSIRFNFGFLAKLLISMSEESYYKIHDLYLRNITEQRGTRIIIALRRYRNITGQWPQKLDKVKSLAPVEIFVDPFNNDSFIYKLTEENFTLYSKGKNNIDEGGKYKRRYGETSEGDDWTIWPPVSRKTRNKKADAQQSNTQKDEVK